MSLITWWDSSEEQAKATGRDPLTFGPQGFYD